MCAHTCPAGLVCLLYLCLLLFTPEGSGERLHLNTEITAMPDCDKGSQRAAAFSSPPCRRGPAVQHHMDVGEAAGGGGGGELALSF